MDPFDPSAPLTKRCFTFPAALAAAFGVPVVVQYGLWIIAPDPAWRLWIWVAGVGLMFVPSVLLEIRARKRMETWRRLSLGELPPSPEHLQRAVREIYGIPDFAFLARIQHWVLGAGGLAVWLGLSGAIDLSQALRVAGLGFVAGPIMCLLPYFAMIQRARALIGRITGMGLTAAQLAQVLPERRMGQRGRLMLLVLIVAGAPTLLMGDAVSVFAQTGLERVAAISDPAERALAVSAALAALRLDALAIAAVLIAFGLFTAASAGAALTDPLRRLAYDARHVAEGKLNAGERVIAEDELGMLATAFGQMQQQLAALIEQLRQAGVQISSTTEQIVLTSSKHERGAERQATALAQTSKTTEELADSARSIASNASDVAEIAQRTRESAEKARSNASSFAAAMERMRSTNAAIAESVHALNGRVGQIDKIVEFINGIADKSDLLALNAELEGVKAGEVGRAFSLVATEMRRMAENVTRSTREIEELIDQIREATTAAVHATETGTIATEGSAAVVGSMSESLATIADLASLTSEAVKTISAATQQQQTGTDQLAAAMGDILGVTKETETATQAIIAANVDLVRLAKDLQDVVQRFHTAPLRA